MPYREESGLMSKSWGDLIIDPTRLRPERAPPKSWRNIPIVEPRRLEADGLNWVAVKTAPKCERVVASELSSYGYGVYCPLGAKYVFWQDGKRSKHKLIKQFPVFFSYIFVGLRLGQQISRYLIHDGRLVLTGKIQSVLGDSQGPLLIPVKAIQDINRRELLNQWDETRRSPFNVEQEIRILRGPFKDLNATVDEISSERRIKALVTIFGRRTPVDLDVSDIEHV